MVMVVWMSLRSIFKDEIMYFTQQIILSYIYLYIFFIKSDMLTSRKQKKKAVHSFPGRNQCDPTNR